MICKACHRWLPEPFFTVRKNHYGYCIRCLRHMGAMREAQARNTKVGYLRWRYRPRRFDGKKECTQCHKVKDRSEFSPHKGGVMSECKACHRARVSLRRMA